MVFTMIPHAKNAFPMLKMDSRLNPADDLFYEAHKPFFHILTDNGIASLFLEAVAANPEDALAFVSKYCPKSIDLDALRSILGDRNLLCQPLIKASFNRDPKNCSTSSVLVVDPEHNKKSLLHLHMIKEPDRFGQWKIYGVEQE